MPISSLCVSSSPHRMNLLEFNGNAYIAIIISEIWYSYSYFYFYVSYHVEMELLYLYPKPY